MFDVLRFDSSAVVVTGAAAGIGRSCCEVLADLGAQILAVDIDPAFRDQRFVTRNGVSWPESHFLADVSAEQDVQELARSIQASHSQLAAVINVAGIGLSTPIAQTDLASWDRVLQVSLSSVFLMTRAFLPLVSAGHGAFVNVSSTYAFSSRARHSAYSAAKAGIVSFTRAVAIEGAAAGVRANSVCPGPVETPRRQRRFDSGEESRERAAKRTLLGRLADPAEIAYLIAFLASRAASYITGGTFVIDGGQLVHIGEVT